MQEGGESHDSFMASLTSQNDSRSLMPADSAFRMVSSVPAQSSEGVISPPCSQWITSSTNENRASWLTFHCVGQYAKMTVPGFS